MKEFPKQFNAVNEQSFPDYHYERVKCYLRRSIYEHVISHKKEEYISLDIFSEKYNISTEKINKMVKELFSELQNLGWSCALSYGDTGLFVYSGEKPSNCY